MKPAPPLTSNRAHAEAIARWVQGRLHAEADYRQFVVRPEGNDIVIEEASGRRRAGFVAMGADRFALCGPEKDGTWDLRSLQTGSIDELTDAIMGLFAFLLVLG